MPGCTRAERRSAPTEMDVAGLVEEIGVVFVVRLGLGWMMV